MPEAIAVQEHLDRVSRSFAFCIRELREPLRHHTGIAYLLFRLLDTAEDAPWPDAQARLEAIAELQRLLIARPTPIDDVRAWAARLPAGVPDGERALLADAPALLQALSALPAPIRAAVVARVQQMAVGMRQHALAWQRHQRLQLHGLPAVNRYCYFVAGIVGELLTELFAQRDARCLVTRERLQLAQHFGLFLQKVNLLKDQRDDEREGRFLCPSRPAMLASLEGHARGALAYITGLPADARDFRTFCAWSLFLGAASLPHIERAHAGAEGSKITRAETQALLAHVAHIACDDAALREALEEGLALLPQLVADAQRAAGPTAVHVEAEADPEGRAWFLRLDHGLLTQAHLAALHMA